MRLTVGNVSHHALDGDAAALIRRMTVPPSPSRRTLINTLVLALKSAGVWAKLTALHVSAAHDSQAGLLNWIGNASYDLTTHGSLTFTTDRGYAGDGSTGYLDTGWSPSLGAQDSLCFGVWNRTEGQFGSGMIGTGTANLCSLNPRAASDIATCRINALGFSITSQTVGVGLAVANRSGPTAADLYRSGASIGSSAVASSTPSAVTLNIHRVNSLFSPREAAAAVIGSSLNSTEHTALYAALLAFMQAVGAA